MESSESDVESTTRLAQWVEHQTDNLDVTGSTPVPTRRLQTCKREERSSKPEGGGRLFGRPRAVVLATARRRRAGSTNRGYAVRGYRDRARSV